jgi:hypothetical protein
MGMLVRVQADCTLVLYDDDERPYAEVRPRFEPALGPVLDFYRIGLYAEPWHLLTLRLPSINELVRKLPIAIAAARRLQNLAEKPAK